MPSALIEVRQQYSRDVELGIMEAVHAALRESFKIMPHDRNIRLLVHEPHRFACPPDRENRSFILISVLIALLGAHLMQKEVFIKLS
nr:hypothetical protein [Desulfuromonas acetoxidans]